MYIRSTYTKQWFFNIIMLLIGRFHIGPVIWPRTVVLALARRIYTTCIHIELCYVETILSSLVYPVLHVFVMVFRSISLLRAS